MSRSFLAGLDTSYDSTMTAERMFRSYFENAPVFIATKKVVDPASSIAPYVKDVEDDKFINHALLKLLKNPNPHTNWTLFAKQWCSYAMLTGNNYLEVTKTNISGGRPIELNILNPKNITILSDSRDGYPSEYSYVGVNGESTIFKRDGNRYINNKNDNELLHWRNFNPDFSGSNFTGVSYFAGCQLEISQYTLASIHNNAMLKNQARPSGLLTYKGSKEDLSDDIINNIGAELQNKFKGASNAGAAALLPGNFDWIQLSQSVKDMDFLNLKKSTEQACYNAAGVPLPLISPDQMTLSNVNEGKYMLYDGAVLPLVNDFFSFLGDKLFPMYNDRRVKNKKDLKLTYDETTIQVLEDRKFSNTKDIYSSGLLTRNEGRALIGYGAEQGGNIFYQPVNLVPVGEDQNINSNRDASDGKSIEVKEYIRLMSTFKNPDNSPKYNQEEIEHKAKTYFKNGQYN